MKVTLERSALLKSLGHVHRVVERRTTIPILSNVLLQADGRFLTLKATDLDLEVTEKLAADVGAVEREVWRVEAATGRSATCGVYDLVRDVPAVDPAAGRSGPAHPVPPPRWRLARALD